MPSLLWARASRPGSDDLRGVTPNWILLCNESTDYREVEEKEEEDEEEKEEEEEEEPKEKKTVRRGGGEGARE